MKISFNFLVVFVLVISVSYSSYSQSDFATVNIYRPKKTYGSGAKHHIIINGEKICYLKSGGHLEYKVFKSDSITIGIYASALGSKSEAKKYDISLEKGNSYYFETVPKFSNTVMNQIESPIPDKKLNYRHFIKDSDYQDDVVTISQSDNQKSNSEKLRELKQLLDDGVITQDDFEKKKEEILSEY